MIESLHIENFAIIDTLDVDFLEHMIVLTGETGAGKSIIIDAIGQLIGDRTQLSFMKTGAEKTYIEGVFDIRNNQEVLQLLEEYGFSVDDKLVVSKTMLRDGKTNVRVNYRNASLTVLKKIMPLIVDIHSQFENHSLFLEQNHRMILDSYIGEPCDKLLKSYTEAYFLYKDLESQYQTKLEEELSDEQLEFYQARLAEIDEVDFSSIDEEQLENEKKILQNFEKTSKKITTYQQYMSHDRGALSSLHQAVQELSYLNDQANYQDLYSKLYDAYYLVSDIHDEIMDVYASSSFDEYRLQEIQDILFKMNALKRKHGQSIEAIMEAKKDLEEKIEAFSSREEKLEALKIDLKQARIACQKEADKLSKLRKKGATGFKKAIEQELKDLYLPNVQFDVSFMDTELQAYGKERIVFMISTNVGQQLQPLQKVASGGELSRIMLAIKTISLSSSCISTIIFDEADTGVSGKVAESIGYKMQNIAKNKQVLCITHLPQVASFAKHHYLIEKKVINKETKVSLLPLSEDLSIKEIAKMISGKEITNESLEHAKTLKDKNHA